MQTGLEAVAKINRTLKQMSPQQLKLMINKCRATIQYPGARQATIDGVAHQKAMTPEQVVKATRDLMGLAQAELNRR